MKLEWKAADTPWWGGASLVAVLIDQVVLDLSGIAPNKVFLFKLREGCYDMNIWDDKRGRWVKHPDTFTDLTTAKKVGLALYRLQSTGGIQ